MPHGLRQPLPTDPTVRTSGRHQRLHHSRVDHLEDEHLDGGLALLLLDGVPLLERDGLLDHSLQHKAKAVP